MPNKGNQLSITKVPSTTKLLVDVHSSILDLSAMLGSAKSATSEYSKFLHDFTSMIPDNSNREEIHSIVLGILQETGKMVGKNLELETHLDRASHRVTELGKYMEGTRKEALTDSLTDIPNRRAFDKQIISCMEEAATYKSPLSLLLIDIDHFKEFNDTHGHVTGDQVLRLVAQTLLHNIKGRDMAARYGGEEFAIILPRTLLAGGQIVAELLRRVIENKKLVDRTRDKNFGQITLSIGVAQYHEGEDVISFVKRVDTALYEAKKTGRNRVCLAS